MSQSESFFRRWSRLKLHPRTEAVKPQVATAPPALPLPAAETLDFHADFSPFMHPEVDHETRRNALRKLFMTDHYRTMDGLDVYVEDYSRPALLPADLLQTLDHAQALLTQPEAQLAAAAAEAEKPEQA